jgi:hypothetical protein
MRVFEREPKFLIASGYLEPVKDFTHEGRPVLASRLGYRITAAFVDRFLGRIFEMPAAVFPDDLLRPETQDLGVFVEGVEAICEAQRTVALNYFEDGSVENACPPIRALLHIMAYGDRDINDPAFRAMFTREAMLRSDWYQDRLRAKQQQDIKLWTRHVKATNSEAARQGLERVTAPEYLRELEGTIGADPCIL